MKYANNKPNMNKELNKGFSPIIIIIILIVVGLIAGGIYFYLNSQTPKTENQTPISVNSETETTENTETSFSQEDLSKLSPKDMWLKIRKEIDDAKNIDAFVTVNMKYGSKENVDYWNSQMGQYNAMPQSFKDSIFSMIKNALPTLDKINIDGIKEEIVGDKATLKIETKDSKEKGEVNLIKEDGIWKLEQEAW